MSILQQQRYQTTTSVMAMGQQEHTNNDTSTTTITDWTQPLLLSLLAGLSTSLGAAFVFCLGRNGHKKQQQQQQQQSNKKKRHNADSEDHVVSHEILAFSLSLAGSVMVTVSFVSILPESFQDESLENQDDNDNGNNSGVYHMIPWQSWLFVKRCLFFGIGCFLYVLLSKCAFPEPNELLVEYDGNNDDEQEGEEEAIATTASLLLFNENNNKKHDIEETASVGSVHSTVSYSSSSGAASPLIKRQLSCNYLRRETSSDGYNSAATTMTELGGGPIYNAQETNKQQGASSTKTAITKSTLTTNSAAITKTKWLIHCTRGSDLKSRQARRAWRVTMLLFISLAVHNFPEGLAVAASTMHSLQLGLTTAVAIALHNIPEGIAIAVPCLAARPDSPCLAFWLASVSGLAEPLGAAVALFVLDGGSVDDNNDSYAANSAINRHNIPDDPAWLSMNNVLAFVAGIMTTVAFVELFPEALRHHSGGDSNSSNGNQKNNNGRCAGRGPFWVGLVVGVVVMIGSDIYLDS